MRRITGANVATDLFGSGKHGFKDRVTGVSAPTTVTSQFGNDFQEELCNAVEGFGFNLGTSNKQLLNAIRLAAVESSMINHAPRTKAGSYTGSFEALATSSAGLLVAAGSLGEIQTSSDGGTTWTKRTQAGGYADIFDGGMWVSSLSLFILVGKTGEIQTSPDGTTWTKRTQAGGYTGWFFGITFGAGLVVIVGTGGEIQTSPDGITWTKRTQAASFSGTFYSATYNGSLFVITGASSIQTSPDGTNWTARTIPSGVASATFLGAAYAGGLFVIVGLSGEVLSSSNGTDWTRRRSPVWTTQNFWNVSARDSSEQGGLYFLAVGEGGVFAASADGLDWRLFYRPARFASPMRASVYHPATSTFLAVGDGAVIRQTLAL